MILVARSSLENNILLGRFSGPYGSRTGLLVLPRLAQEKLPCGSRNIHNAYFGAQSFYKLGILAVRALMLWR